MPTVEDLGNKVKAKYPGSYDDMSSVDLGRRFKVKHPGAYDDFTEAAPAPPSSRSESLIERGKKDLHMGFQSGAADVAHTVANVANVVPIPAVRDFGKRAEEYAKTEAPSQQDLESHQGVMDQVLQAAGQVPSQLVKYAPTQLAGRFGPVVGGLISAAGEMDKGWKPALKAGVEGAAMFYAMDKAGGIKRLAPRVAANAAIMATPAAIESGGDIKKTTAAAITGGAFGIPSHNERMTKVRAREALKGGLDTAAALGDEIQRNLAPQDRTEAAGLSGRVLREQLAEMHVSSSRAEFALKEARKAFGKLPPTEVQGFYRMIEGDPGEAANATPQMQTFATNIRKVLDDKRDQVIRETGRLKEFYEDYFPHIWKDPDKAAEFTKNFYAAKRPLQGGGTRFRERTIPTIDEGLKAHLELAHDNPVDAVLATVRELDRFMMAKRVIKQLRPASTKNPEGYNVLKFIPEGRQAPKGYQEINDSAFKVSSYGSKTIRAADTTSITTDIDPASKGELVTPMAKPKVRAAGRWVAPEAVAQIFNNYLSKGLSGSMIYRGLRTVGNTLNQAQLGFSAFHAGFTSVDSVISRYALGIEQMVHGMRTADPKMTGKGLVSMVSSPAAPITNAIKGWNLKKALLDPGSIKDPAMRDMTMMAIQAGARADVDPIYRNNLKEKMQKSFREDKPLLAALRLPGALIEMTADPLMSHFVPWQKLGVFSDLARFEMDKLEQSAAKGQDVTRDMKVKAMQKTWDSVDNRMGQMVNDNLFWDKTAKDLGHLAIRSVGWNLGTIREVVGGVKDWGSFFKDAATSQKAEFTHRMAYVTAMPMVVGMMGAISNYMFTGKPPESWKDYLAPRTGRKDEQGREERIWYPSYMKEIYHYATDPLGTMASKIHPLFGIISQMLHNEDFYGVQIVNHNDPLIAQLLEESGYVVEQFSPLSVKTAATREAGPETPWEQKVAAYFGVVPAAATLKKSKAENYAATVLAEENSKGARTLEQEQTRVALRGINAAIRAHTDPMPLIKQAVAEEILSPEGIAKSIKKGMDYSPLAKNIRDIRDIEEAMNTFRMASPTERLQTLPVMAKKIMSEAKQINALPGKRKRRFAREALEIHDLSIQVARSGGR